MRVEDDHIRSYVPVLRRIIILVAVLTAIPVVMWTITASVRTYVGPPKAPTFQPAAAPANADGKSTALPLFTEARAATTDNGGGTTSAGPNGSGLTAPVKSDPAVVSASNPQATDGSGQPQNGAPVQAAQQPPTFNWPAPPAAADDTPPSAEPLAGPVPLPRKRPQTFAMAMPAPNAIPLPRPRPGLTAGEGADSTGAQSHNFLQNMFQQNGDGAPMDNSGLNAH